MTRDDLRLFLRRYLGDGVVGVELTDQHLDTAIDSALHWLSGYIKKEGAVTLSGRVGQSKFDLSGLPLHAKVVDVRRAPSPSLSSPFSPFFYEDISDVSDYAIRANYAESVRKLLGKDPVWKYEPPFLYIDPPSSGNETIRVVYVIPFTDPSEVPYDLLHPFVEYTKACAKEILARIRGKYRGVPAPEGTVELDYSDLLSEAQQEKETATQELLRRIPSAGFAVG